ncbi:MAG: YARHG domain-containing protein [Fibromonadales bacterium]|nr:YARHG domain-containing protein [Fibromonadales bacterium]
MVKLNELASSRLLTAVDLQNLSKKDLRIMRNEIFARHGYIFQTNDMKTYFKSQDWYIPKYNDVNSMLTDIEIKNIELIKRYE